MRRTVLTNNRFGAPALRGLAGKFWDPRKGPKKIILDTVVVGVVAVVEAINYTNVHIPEVSEYIKMTTPALHYLVIYL